MIAPYGYKARSLHRIEASGLPTVCNCILRFEPDLLDVSEGAIIFKEEFDHAYHSIGSPEYWTIRVDHEFNDGSLHPLYSANNLNYFEGAVKRCFELNKNNPRFSFILSEAPDDTVRDSNVVCWPSGDILFGEISFDKGYTLRKAWTAGHLLPFQIDGSVGDYIRNRGDWLSVYRIDYLRALRKLMLGREGFEYECSIGDKGNPHRIIVWQELALTENRDTILGARWL